MKTITDLEKFLGENTNNKSASVILIQLLNKEYIVKKVGLAGLYELSKMISKTIPTAKHQYCINSTVAEGVHFLATTHLNRSQAIALAEKIQHWFVKNNFFINGIYLFVKTKCIILTDLQKKKNIANLIKETEHLLFSSNLQKNITILGETKEDEFAYHIKTHLLTAIKNKSYHWKYTKIVSTNIPEQEIYQLDLEIPNTPQKPLTRDNYYSIAKDCGLIKLLNKSTLSQALNKISENVKVNKKQTIIINQSFDTYLHDNKFTDTIGHLKSLKLPKNSFYFKFNYNELIDHFGILEELSNKLHAANINICISGFNCSKIAWKIARKMNSDWIKLKFTCDPSPQYYDSNLLRLSHTIKKAHTFGYKVFITQVECNYFAADLWKLGIDYVQGNFIETSNKEFCKKISYGM